MSTRILVGHVLDMLKTLPDEHVQACVTSPPYWGLRDYGTKPVAWPAITYSPMPGLSACVEVPAMICSLGLEPTLDSFIGHMILVFREVRRVLKDDGTVWMNMGDSYAGNRGREQGPVITGKNKTSSFDGQVAQRNAMTASRRRDNEPIPRSDVRIAGLKPKDLVGQPWRLALALQADGWWLRQDIIWQKLNPMPESVRDRCTKAHEYVFLLAKSARYFYDFEAMQEPCSESTNARVAQDVEAQAGSLRAHAGEGRGGKPMKAMVRKLPGNKTHKGTAAYEAGDEKHRTKAGLVAYSQRLAEEAERPIVKYLDRQQERAAASARMGRGAGFRKVTADDSGTKNNESFNQAMVVMPAARNRRSVWTVGTEPFKEAHFATFPTELIRPCIEASTPIGGTVLDIFFGAGTTGLVCDRLQRNCIGIELNPVYAEIARRRIVGESTLLADVEVVA